jgi:hypothetical protein
MVFLLAPLYSVSAKNIFVKYVQGYYCKARRADMPEDHTYNGWTNYETWAVNHWLAIEEADHEWLMALSVDPNIASLDDKAEVLKDMIADITNPLIDQTGLYKDLLGAALGEVNWLEILEKNQDNPS